MGEERWFYNFGTAEERQKNQGWRILQTRELHQGRQERHHLEKYRHKGLCFCQRGKEESNKIIEQEAFEPSWKKRDTYKCLFSYYSNVPVFSLNDIIYGFYPLRLLSLSLQALWCRVVPYIRVLYSRLASGPFLHGLQKGWREKGMEHTPWVRYALRECS